MGDDLLQPRELAKICLINVSTLNGYLRDKELFPPVKVDPNNGFRYYDDNTVINLELLKRLRKKPFRLTIYEIKPIIIKYDLTARKAMLSKPNSELLSLINEMTGVL